MDPFRYAPTPPDRQPKKKKNIQSYFTPFPSIASASQPSQTQPTLDSHRKKKYKESAFEYITKWWYDTNIPFNGAFSPYYQPMWDYVIAIGNGFKGPSLHDLRGFLLKKEVSSIEE
jgi:hypothetical protein